MKNAKNVMTKAWSIARSAQSKFGGSVKQYFAMALKQAWIIVKMLPMYIKLEKKNGISLDKVTFYNGKVRYAVSELHDSEWFDSVIEAMEVFKSWVQEKEDEYKMNMVVAYTLI